MVRPTINDVMSAIEQAEQELSAIMFHIDCMENEHDRDKVETHISAVEMIIPDVNVKEWVRDKRGVFARLFNNFNKLGLV